MNGENLEKKYINSKGDIDKKNIRTEILFAPLLVLLPFIVGFFMIYDWYIRDFTLGEVDLFCQLIIGLVIIFGNILFDIPFLKNLRIVGK